MPNNTPIKHALLVIDVQDSFIHTVFWSDADLPAYREQQLALIATARTCGVPVIGVLHENLPEQTNSPSFLPASGFVRLMDWMPAVPQVFKKSVHNALTDSGLLQYLHEQKITDLTISGIRTEQCCETTTRVASDLGFNVYFVTEATLTFTMSHADGTVFSADEIKKRTELVLAGRFAQICSVAQMSEIWA
jgi:nicotinamidase-related amidase